MTKEELLDSFEYKYGYTREFMSELIDSAMEEKYWATASDVICKKVSIYLPSVGRYICRNDSQWEEQKEYMEWRDTLLFDNGWLNDKFKELWRSKHGVIRTKEEACALAADQWCRHMFVSAYQDNGGGNDNLTLMGMFLKVNAQDKITEEVKKKVWQGIYDFYYDEDHYQHNNYYQLSTDYYPCTWLVEILKNAGIEENLIDSICPWKSHLKIDKDDNSLYCLWYNTDKEVL